MVRCERLLGRFGVGLHLTIAHSQCRRWFALCSCFPVFFLYLFVRIENICFFFFAILAFLEFLTFSRWFSSLKKSFKNHDGKTPSPANHEMESFGRVP